MLATVTVMVSTAAANARFLRIGFMVIVPFAMIQAAD